MNEIVTAQVNTKAFEEALIQFKTKTQLGWPQVIKMQARLMVERLIEWTPPFGKDKSAQKKGQATVAGDIRRVFLDFHNFEFRNLSIQKAWETEDRETLDRIFKASPSLSRYRLLDAPDPAIHQNLRRNGRVAKRRLPTFVVMDGGKSGQTKIARYITTVQKRVGKAKAGWIAAAQFLTAKFPAWITKSGSSIGTVQDYTNRLNNPSVIMRNEIEYVSEIFPDSKMSELLSTRIRDMEKNADQYLRAKAREARL